MEKDDADYKIENNILRGKEDPYQSDYMSLGKFALDILENSPDVVGQIDGLTGEQYTYSKMRERSVRCALWMRSQGLLPEEVVMVCSHNQLDIPIPCYAALYLGAAVNPLDTGMNAREILHLINIIKPKMAFVSEESATAVAGAAEQAQIDLKIIVFGRVTGFLEFESIIAEPGIDEVKSFTCTPIEQRDRIAFVICTSGTTGLPKGVAISHECMLKQLVPSEQLSWIAGKRYLILSPLSWISGTQGIFTHLLWRVTKIIVPTLEEYSTCEVLEKFRVNLLFLGSSAINRLLKSGALEKYNLSCMKLVIYGGAPLALASREAFAKVLPSARIISGYGTTEVGGLISLQSANSKPSSAGKIVKNAQLRVMDPNTGQPLGPNETGEILAKTANMMNCYYNAPQATAEAVDEEGWFHTGDLGYYDEDGEIFVVDRLKELIKYRGYHVSPVEIEDVILSHPGVKEVTVVGVPHPSDDEHPLAFVVRATDSTGVGKQVTEKEIVDHVAAVMSERKRLHAGVRFIDCIPKTPAGKYRRKELRELAKSMTSIGAD